MLNKLLSQVVASVRDVILAGVAAFSGVIIAHEVIPQTSLELRALLAAALYAAVRAVVGKVAELLA